MGVPLRVIIFISLEYFLKNNMHLVLSGFNSNLRLKFAAQYRNQKANFEPPGQ